MITVHGCNEAGQDACSVAPIDAEQWLRAMQFDLITCEECLAQIIENQQRVMAAMRVRLAAVRGLS